MRERAGPGGSLTEQGQGVSRGGRLGGRCWRRGRTPRRRRRPSSSRWRWRPGGRARRHRVGGPRGREAAGREAAGREAAGRARDGAASNRGTEGGGAAATGGAVSSRGAARLGVDQGWPVHRLGARAPEAGVSRGSLTRLQLVQRRQGPASVTASAAQARRRRPCPRRPCPRRPCAPSSPALCATICSHYRPLQPHACANARARTHTDTYTCLHTRSDVTSQ
jgi:hypothetical protein